MHFAITPHSAGHSFYVGLYRWRLVYSFDGRQWWFLFPHKIRI